MLRGCVGHTSHQPCARHLKKTESCVCFVLSTCDTLTCDICALQGNILRAIQRFGRLGKQADAEEAAEQQRKVAVKGGKGKGAKGVKGKRAVSPEPEVWHTIC